jgi:hypothetical protein
MILGLWLGELQIGEAEGTQPLRFRLGELFATITVAAVLLALFRSAGILGAVFAFLSALAFTNVVYPCRRPLVQQAAMFDFIWGIVMPVVCLVFDPFVFKFEQSFAPILEGDLFAILTASLWSAPEFYGRTIPAYAFVATQILFLGIWLVAGRLPADLSAVWAGVLFCGFAFSAFVAMLLLVPAILGTTVLGTGLLGLTPFFTARSFHRRALFAGSIAMRELPALRAQWLAMIGYFLPAPLPVVLYAIVRGFDFL